jgi:hypothetical protein
MVFRLHNDVLVTCDDPKQGVYCEVDLGFGRVFSQTEPNRTRRASAIVHRGNNGRGLRRTGATGTSARHANAFKIERCHHFFSAPVRNEKIAHVGSANQTVTGANVGFNETQEFGFKAIPKWR